MSLGLLFPGQGTQHAAMLPWLDAPGRDAPPALRQMAARLGADWRARLADPAWAGRNDVAQLLLTGVSLAAWQRLQPLLQAFIAAPAAIAGYSVGELAAFSAAGVFDAATALDLAQRRAALMDACMQPDPEQGTHTDRPATGLLAVTGAPPALPEQLCARHGLALAIRLGPGAAIVGGPDAALQAAHVDAVAAGASAVRLAVAIASHTPWLAAAVAPLAAALEALPFAPAQSLLVCNLDGRAHRRSTELRHALAAQVAQTVCWDRCMDTLAERGLRCVLEVGPGTTLSRMWNARHPTIPARALDEFRQPEAAANWVRQTLGGRAG